ncbi:MAG: hypothetical protein LJE96_02955, partial [Deltaproteobacteria bacterium]|nr:hypothetical protein [Deltaproteobacteria bacterium]
GCNKMEPVKIAKQMVEFQKATFDNSFNAMSMVQEQAERMINMGLDQANWLPEEGKRVVDAWLKSYKKGREDFKKIVDGNFTRVEQFFAGTEKTQKKK